MQLGNIKQARKNLNQPWQLKQRDLFEEQLTTPCHNLKRQLEEPQKHLEQL